LKLRAVLIRKLVEEHKARTPFSELPENISIQLTALTTACPNANAQISQLAGSLGDLYSKHQHEIKKQKTISIWSFLVGIIGLIIGITIPLLPQSSKRADSSQVHGSATPTPTPR